MSQNTDDRRIWSRMNTLFPVLVETAMQGFINCIARNISGGGIFLESSQLLPLGSTIAIYFSLPRGGTGITAHGEVKNHYYLNYPTPEGIRAVTGMGVRFLQFEDDGIARMSNNILADLAIQ